VALTARSIGAGAAQSIASGHPASGGRNVASATFSPITEASIQTEIHPDANFSFHDFSAWMHDRNQMDQNSRAKAAGVFETNTITFVSLLKQRQADGESGSSAVDSKHSSQSLLAKAIRAYEGTASVIHDSSKSLGSSLSLSL